MKYLEHEYVGVVLGLVVVAVIGSALYVLTPRALEGQEVLPVEEPALTDGTIPPPAATAPTPAPQPLVDTGRPLTIVSPLELPEAVSGTPYSVTLVADGAIAGDYRWSITGGTGAFPVPGLALSAKSGKTVRITGIPAEMYFDQVKATAPVTFTVRLLVQSGTQQIAKQYRLTVNPVAP